LPIGLVGQLKIIIRFYVKFENAKGETQNTLHSKTDINLLKIDKPTTIIFKNLHKYIEISKKKNHLPILAEMVLLKKITILNCWIN